MIFWDPVNIFNFSSISLSLSTRRNALIAMSSMTLLNDLYPLPRGLLLASLSRSMKTFLYLSLIQLSRLASSWDLNVVLIIRCALA